MSRRISSTQRSLTMLFLDSEICYTWFHRILGRNIINWSVVDSVKIPISGSHMSVEVLFWIRVHVPTEERQLDLGNPKRTSLLLLRPSATRTSANTPPWTSAPALCPGCLQTKDPWWRQRACLLHLRRPLWTWPSANCTLSRQTLCRTPCLTFLPTPASTAPPDTRCSKWVGWTNSLLRGKTATLKPKVSLYWTQRSLLLVTA